MVLYFSNRTGIGIGIGVGVGVGVGVGIGIGIGVGTGWRETCKRRSVHVCPSLLV